MRTPKLLTTMTSYSIDLFKADLFAGITVALVALPLSLAIAIASGATPGAGLVTAIVAGLLISLLGGSSVQIGGPTGAFIVVVAGVIATHGYDGLVIATLMAGVFLVASGFLGLGRLISYIPDAVINGFTIGIAIIIATSQIPDFLGLSGGPFPADFMEKLPVILDALPSLNVAAVGIAVLTMVMIIVLRTRYPRFPGLLVAVFIASVLVAVLSLDVDTLVSRFGALPTTLPAPQWPNVTFDRLVVLLPSALIIAFLAGVESLLSATVADKMIGDKHKPNAELTAQGIANMASALFGGMPATGAIARTATNVRAGGKTPVAGIVHALALLIIMLVAAPLAGLMVMPALAALLMLTAWNMSEPHKWGEYLRAPKGDVFVLLLTLVLTVIVDLTVAISIGVVVGLLVKWLRTKADAKT